ncbi:MAG: hypothetical protein HPY50_15525 [Firmicutes bacterium]|nr:hypothetical protein [Bacillota bacterium]
MKSAEMSKILSMLDKMAFQELLADIRGKSLEHYHELLNQGFTSEDALLDTIAQACYHTLRFSASIAIAFSFLESEDREQISQGITQILKTFN